VTVEGPAYCTNVHFVFQQLAYMLAWLRQNT